jgi:hypothetical protein
MESVENSHRVEPKGNEIGFVNMANSVDTESFIRARMDDLLMEWLDQPATKGLIDRVLGLAKEGMLLFSRSNMNIP